MLSNLVKSEESTFMSRVIKNNNKKEKNMEDRLSYQIIFIFLPNTYITMSYY